MNQIKSIDAETLAYAVLDYLEEKTPPKPFKGLLKKISKEANNESSRNQTEKLKQEFIKGEKRRLLKLLNPYIIGCLNHE